MTDPQRPKIPPYMPYRTFVSMLDHLKEIGTPTHIDRSVLSKYPNGVHSWIKSGLRTMGLLSASDEPSQDGPDEVGGGRDLPENPRPYILLLS